MSGSEDRILKCAVEATADVIVRDDTLLLVLGRFRGIPIQRVAEFLTAFEGRREAKREYSVVNCLQSTTHVSDERV